MRILVTGATGLLGLNLCLLAAKDHIVVGIANQSRLRNLPFTMVKQNLTDGSSLEDLVDGTTPDLVINCAALANLELCESQPDEARKINAEMPGQFAKICLKRAIQFVHISTDAVFNGEDGNYVETDPPNPLSIYAKSKLDGEILVQNNNPQALIARVNFYGFSISGKRSLAEFFINNLKQEKKVHGFTDIFFSPLYVCDLTTIIFEMVKKELSGIFHVVSRNHLSKYDFGMMLARKLNLNGSFIIPIVHTKSGLTAKRSRNLFLNSDKLQSTGIRIPTVAMGVDQLFVDYEKGLPGEIQSYRIKDDKLEEA